MAITAAASAPPLVDDDKRLVEDARHRESLGGRHPGEVGRARAGEIGEPEPFELAHRSEAVVAAEARQPEIDVDTLRPPASNAGAFSARPRVRSVPMAGQCPRQDSNLQPAP